MEISAVIITKNEEDSLERLLKSLYWVDQIVIIDDFSIDKTLEIANKFQAKVVSHKFEGFSKQRNFGLKCAEREWVLSLDADEEIPEESIELLKLAISTAQEDVGGFRILRRNFVLGKWLKHARKYGKRVKFYDIFRMFRDGYCRGDYIGGAIKLFRKEKSYFEGIVHEEPVVKGKIKQMQAYINHYTGDSIHDIFNKVNFYTTLHANQISKQTKQYSGNFFNLVFWRPIKIFFFNYIRKKGFLDGRSGLIQCFADMNYEFLKNIKLYDYYYGYEKDVRG